VNHELFDPTLAVHRLTAADLRRQLGLATTTRVVLFAGKFLSAKQPAELLEAFLALPPSDAALVFVGDGPEKAALVARAQQTPAGRVHFLPFANQTEMPARLLLADLFVLPSRGHYETWGLAVNEAMHMGRPALVSDLVGCQRDLVSDGETGWVFPAASATGLSEKLSEALHALAETRVAARIHAAVAARISGYTYAQTTAGLLAALDSIPARHRT
jgi:glycosyltransferase involved in cell wall biosynthesis